jgi:HSP20 family protein
MALVRWAPARDLYPVQTEINRLFNTLFDTATPIAATRGSRQWTPALDVVENDGDYVVRADLPGIDEDDVKVEVKDGVLTISGERKSEHEERKDGYHRIERSFGSFTRSLTLPEGVDPESVKATFDKGVLEIQVPKPEAPKAHTVEITGGAAA